MVNKQPDVDTPTVTKAVEEVIRQLQPSLPKDVQIARTFRQANFIDAAIDNVRDSLRDGIIIVSIILFMFLMNWRTAAITLRAIPLSLLIGLMLMHWVGLGINTMILGGLVVAIGSVVDDSILDMENCYRRLRINQKLGNPKPPLQVVYDGSMEVRLAVPFHLNFIYPLLHCGRSLVLLGYLFLVEIRQAKMVGCIDKSQNATYQVETTS